MLTRPFLGITVLGDFIVSEGIESIVDNLLHVGASAVAVNPTVTCEADQDTGHWQPPLDAGHSPRGFDRPLFGKRALWLKSGVSFRPSIASYRDSKYGPRRVNELTDREGPLIEQFIDACLSRNMEVYLQIGAVQPTGLRDEDRPCLPHGAVPTGRVADVGSLASPNVRAYNWAYASDLNRAYPRITGFRIDWPEYPCYTPDEVFQDFGDHVACWAETKGIDFDRIRREMAECVSVMPKKLTNEFLAQLAEPGEGRSKLQNWVKDFPAVGLWLRLKSMLSVEMVRDWRNIVDSLNGRRKKLSVHAFMPPFSVLTGFDFANVALLCDSLSPKLYTMHWCLMVNLWGKWILERNPELEEDVLTKALLNLLELIDDHASQSRLEEFAYPKPNDVHPIGEEAQRMKVQQVVQEVNGQTDVYPLVHGYGPTHDFDRRLRIGLQGGTRGIWINRYGYLSNEKLDIIRKMCGAG